MNENDVMETAAEDVQQEAVPEVQDTATDESATATVDATTTDDDVERLVAEAEERGYMRGRNEVIAEVMKRPGIWEGPLPPTGNEQSVRSRPVVLSNVRHSVWDM